MNEDDVRLRSLIDEAKDLARRRDYPTAEYFLDLAAADVRQVRPSVEARGQRKFGFERHWSWSWPRHQSPRGR
jgi:hypothetical protein